MDSRQLAAVMNADRYTRGTFLGVFPSDRLPEDIKQYPASLIANVDKSNQPGSHWIAIYIDREEQGIFFDSYGNGPGYYTDSFKAFLEKNTKNYKFNTKCLQSMYSTVCGHYCLYFILMKSRRFSLETIVSRFGENKSHNDETVKQFIVNHFGSEIHNTQKDSSVSQTPRSRHEQLIKY